MRLAFFRITLFCVLIVFIVACTPQGVVTSIAQATATQTRTRPAPSDTPTLISTNTPTQTPSKPPTHLPPTATDFPTFIPNLPNLSSQECLDLGKADSNKLLGVWVRTVENQISRYYFRGDNTVLSWDGGFTAEGLHIQPDVFDGTYSTERNRLTLKSVPWPLREARYSVCGDRLVVQGPFIVDGSLTTISLIRLPEHCWEYADWDPNQCYPDH